MRRISRMLGVTLLEIMLVLAIAAFIVVMSIRFYQSAQQSAITQDLQNAIATMMSTADSIGLASGSYANIADASILMSNIPSSIKVPNSNSLKSPWGDIAVTADGKAGSSYNVQLVQPAMPAATCQQLAGFAKNAGGAHIATGGATCEGGTVKWTYNYTATAS